MKKAHFDIILKGDITNIGLAFQSMLAAERLNIYGYIKYADTNSVVIEAEGNSDNLNEFITWCNRGIFKAKGVSIQVKANEIKNYKTFTINDIQRIR